MTFISYAQNFEDVMLWRALKHIEKGFYVDVGAAWPDEHSVTKAFYEQGWNGINIEPNAEFIDRYVDERPRDKSLGVALGEKAGEAEMFFISNTGLSSLDKGISADRANEGWESAPAVTEIRTLANVCDEYCLENDIHFLKVDVEGFEEQVLKGNDWVRFRPWVVLVEATLPMSQVESYEGWEPILLDANYSLAYADGLNRFYISKEHEELFPAFKYPPNVFDEFKLIAEIQAEARAEQAEVKARAAETKAEQSEAKANQAEAKANQAEAKANQAEVKAEELHIALHSVYTSRSWRITAPLRWLILQIRLLRQYGLFSRIKALIKKILGLLIGRGVAFMASHPGLRFRLIALLRKLGLYDALRLVYLRLSRSHRPKKAGGYEGPDNLQDLTPLARRIYADLKNAIGKQQNKNN